MTATSLPRGSLPAPAGSGRPEAWLWAIAGVGWVALAVLPFAGGHHGTGSPVAHAAGYLAMVAVMAPLIAPNVRYAAVRSPGRARRAVAAGVVAGWALVWIGAAVLLGLGAWWLAYEVGLLAAIGLATVGAAAWQWTPLKRRSLARCDRRLAPPLDRRRARWASGRFGVVLGRDCVVSCGPLMALMAAAGHSVAVAAACVAVAWYERRRRPHHDPATWETSLGITAIGATALVAAVLL